MLTHSSSMPNYCALTISSALSHPCNHGKQGPAHRQPICVWSLEISAFENCLRQLLKKLKAKRKADTTDAEEGDPPANKRSKPAPKGKAKGKAKAKGKSRKTDE